MRPQGEDENCSGDKTTIFSIIFALESLPMHLHLSIQMTTTMNTTTTTNPTMNVTTTTTANTVKHKMTKMITNISVENVENEHDTWLCAYFKFFITLVCVQ